MNPSRRAAMILPSKTIVMVALVLASCRQQQKAGFDASVDAAPPDTGLADARQSDAGPSDAGLSDASSVPLDAGHDGPSVVHVYPPESNDVIINPGKGWVMYGHRKDFNGKIAEVWANAAVCYVREDWAALEPQEGVFDWSLLEDSLDLCVSKGKKFAFSIMPANTCSPAAKVAPDWVFAPGSSSYLTYHGLDPQTNACGSGPNVLKAPGWTDAFFLQKQAAFIATLAARYDGNEDIAYIDASSCGNWGEWHSLGCSELGAADRKALVDQWNVFKSTPIIVPTNYDVAEVQATYGTDTYGFGIRRESSDVDQHAAGYAYDKAPAVSEWSAPYDTLKLCQGWAGNCWTDHLIADYMSTSMFSYDNIGQFWIDSNHFYQDNPTLVTEWANRMGYWFRLVEAAFTGDLGNGSLGSITFKVRNDGVAPIYVNKKHSFVRLALLNAQGTVLARTAPLSGVNPFDWKPAQVITTTTAFQFPSTVGAQRLAIGVFSSLSKTDPDVRFGNSGTLPNGWYPL